MVFSSLLFLFLYLPVVLLLYYIVPRHFRTPVLFLVSLAFYGWGEPVYISIMLFSTMLDYTCGYFAGKYRTLAPKKAKAAVWVSVIINLSMLAFFKYADFFIENLRVIPGLEDLPAFNIALPIGISFYTFQSMSYTIDVYRNEAPAQRNLVSFGAYITLFPQLIAGPIVRYRDIAKDLNDRKETMEQFGLGVQRFLIGLGKKVLLANNFGLLWDLYQAQPAQELSVLGAWVGLAGYSLQIYFDFSGYSDMAIGLGRMFGFSFPENFNYPYVATSITDFWRRWHISLSTWFREYVYIPLGGNRKGHMKTYRNLLIVWALTGFWHGASWNFLAWGVYFALLLMLEKAFFIRVLQKLPQWARHIYTLVLVLFSWALFALPSLPHAFSYIGALFGAGNEMWIDRRGLFGLIYWMPLLAIGILGSTPGPKKWANRLFGQATGLGAWCQPVFCMLVLVLCTAYLVDASYNPFLYFRF